MGRMLRIITVVVAGLLAAGCMSSEPKVAEVEQVSADQRAALTATEGAGGEGGGAGGGGATWVAIDIAYESAPPELPAGPVDGTLVNNGAIEHNVVFEETGEKVLDAGGGQTDTATFELEPGDYVYFCDVPGHREAGMEGTLTVSG